jgi:hypothetical protein
VIAERAFDPRWFEIDVGHPDEERGCGVLALLVRGTSVYL